ncbi:GNAT family N-acetyltransferase [Branchiibius cervicis]|uniref:GNAT family N-acetyltransferase n=1 Tax=Branchiibius cervicis TaxID=908252 RepID=A0ABW2AQX9_9MICO
MADASVRLAGPQDAAAIGAAQADLFRSAYAEVLAPEVLAAMTPQAFADGWRASLTSPPSNEHFLLLASDERAEVVGLAAVVPSTEHGVAELSLFGVRPDAREQGHGSRLLNAVADLLKEGNATAVQVWIPAADEQLRAFLTAAGLAPDGAWRDREVDADGRTTREVRLTATLGD